MVVGSVHLLETFEFFHALHTSGWDGVWQLDQFPFREDSVQAAKDGIETMRGFHRALHRLDHDALRAAQDAQDALWLSGSSRGRCTPPWPSGAGADMTASTPEAAVSTGLRRGGRCGDLHPGSRPPPRTEGQDSGPSWSGSPPEYAATSSPLSRALGSATLAGTCRSRTSW